MTKKTYSFGNLGKEEPKQITWDELQNSTQSYSDPFSQKTVDDLYKKYLTGNPCNEVSLSTKAPSYTTSNVSSTQLSIKDIQDLLNLYGQPKTYNWTSYGEYNTYNYIPKVEKSDAKVEVRLDDGSVESITREELIKYIGERKIVRENEVVRKVYERYQVAVKLVRSDDNGDSGV